MANGARSRATVDLAVSNEVLARLAGEISKLEGPAPPTLCFRFTVNSNAEPELALDLRQPEDRLFFFEGDAVLAIPGSLTREYSGRTLDVNAAGDYVLI